MAVPSLKNSGLLTTVNESRISSRIGEIWVESSGALPLLSATLAESVLRTCSRTSIPTQLPLPTGTVDLLMMIR